ncbi:MAG: serine hydroxymethyltransferase [Alphaproteobacteria bacterium]|nr:serine hydroxymethyltransferase [Alphaproteobacteria bacterium]
MTPSKVVQVARATPGFFAADLAADDPELMRAIQGEIRREQTQIDLIASQNFTSPAVLAAQGSVMTNKYAEGYPGRRYYGGCEHVDAAERLAIERIKQLFGSTFANVQPHSGSQANQAVYLALLKPGDVILGLGIDAGGHLTHGSPVNLSGKWLKAVAYGVRRQDSQIDADDVQRLAEAHRPKLIIAGGSAYPRVIDFARFRAIADSVGAHLMVDMAHFAGLVAGGAHPSPIPHAHVVTATTHKTLRGPRGGLILCNDADLAKRIDSAVFPGLQGGPLMHVIAAKAVAFREALQPSFAVYARQVVANAKALGASLVERGYDLVTGGTDTHLMLVDLRRRGLTGKAAEAALERANICSNKNVVPFDSEKPTITSGLRFGTPSGTTRGFGTAEFQAVGRMIADVLDALVRRPAGDPGLEARVRTEAGALCARFPVYPGAL